jgi:hypothetical protein
LSIGEKYSILHSSSQQNKNDFNLPHCDIFIVNLSQPIDSFDAAIKKYVDRLKKK